MRGSLILLAVCLTLSVPPVYAEAIETGTFLKLLHPSPVVREESFKQIRENWRPGFSVMLLEVNRFQREVSERRRIYGFLRKKLKPKSPSPQDWYREIWSEQYKPHPEYAKFKAQLYSLLDPRFSEYFNLGVASTIRLDEIQWGGVVRDGIPPLRYPEMIQAAEANYLNDSDVVFGVAINGDTRAYPKRILAWHEMFTAEVGGVEITGAYCTLCGSMIVYESVANGTHHKLGTSGFLYRSNKLMYDEGTKSLWNTLLGEPVVGSLVGADVSLHRRSVVTSTWGEWRSRHPQTTVLAPETGYQRDYSEGAAYRAYFATDTLMFPVPFDDRRLNNKDEVLALLPHKAEEREVLPLAISSKLLRENPLYEVQLGEEQLLILTDNSGAHRVYAVDEVRFTSWDGSTQLIDAAGSEWTLNEDALHGEVKLPRFPSHNAFWFGWHAAYPQTHLIKE